MAQPPTFWPVLLATLLSVRTMVLPLAWMAAPVPLVSVVLRAGQGGQQVRRDWSESLHQGILGVNVAQECMPALLIASGVMQWGPARNPVMEGSAGQVATRLQGCMWLCAAANSIA